MKLSINWLKQYVDFELPPTPELVEKIGAQLGAVEEVIELGEQYAGVVVAKVVECHPLEGSDHLNVCLIDDGGITPDVNRQENGLVQVVCGAPNVRAGLLVAWLPPGVIVPSTYGREPFVLEARKLRGVVSNGMLASPKELAIGDSHEGIMELGEAECAPGDDFASVYGLDDTIIDIENKMFTHRPDCFGQLGLAREVAGILGHEFHSPAWYLSTQQAAQSLDTSANELPLVVRNEVPELVPRFVAVSMANVSGDAVSPVWLQASLSRVGIRPINLLVDITNYMMMLTGQPLHAYDYDKVRALSHDDAASLVVRQPHVDEQLTLLSGKTISPRPEAILIASDASAVGLGGVMGGANTEVSAETKRIILECATFDMYSIRRTSMAHGLFSEAVTRFNKGQSPLQNDRILAETIRLIKELTDGQAALASPVVDLNHLDTSVRERDSIFAPVPVRADFINARLGLDLSVSDMAQLLGNVECKVDQTEEELRVHAPFWRTDIELREDVVEEVGRLYGFDKLPLELPVRSMRPAAKDSLLSFKDRLREQLSRGGANEVLTYSFVRGDLLSKVDQDTARAYKLSNALSPDLQYYRQTLLPSLLDKVHANSKAGYERFAIFELGKGHLLPGELEEYEKVALVFAADKKGAAAYQGAAFYQARAHLMGLLESLGIDESVTLQPIDSAKAATLDAASISQFDPSRCAVVMHNNTCLGVIGEFKMRVQKSLKLPEFSAGFELDIRALLLASSVARPVYRPLSRFPGVSQDICLRVIKQVSYEQLRHFMRETLTGLQPPNTTFSLRPIDIYVRQDDADYKQITFRLTIASQDKTLTDKEVNNLLDVAANAAQVTFSAERI